MMKSERVLVQVAGASDWRGDELRFQINSGDALLRRKELRRHKNVTAAQIVMSSDEPTHTYVSSKSGHPQLTAMQPVEWQRPDGWVDIPAPEGFVDEATRHALWSVLFGVVIGASLGALFSVLVL